MLSEPVQEVIILPTRELYHDLPRGKGRMPSPLAKSISAGEENMVIRKVGFFAGIIFGMSLSLSGARVAGKELSGDLVITADLYLDAYDCIADAFMEEYPNVSVRIDRPTQEEMSTDEFYQRMKLKLMSGECGDIIASNYFGTESTHLEGVFEELYHYMDGDPKFHKEDYFSSLYQVFETEGKLYQVMLYGQPVYLRLNRELLDRAGVEYPRDEITFWELAQIYRQVKCATGSTVYLTEHDSFDPLAPLEYGYYVWNDAFATEEFEQYLEANHEMDYREEGRPIRNMIDERILEDSLCREVWCISMQAADVTNRMFSETDELTESVLYKTAHGEAALSSYACFSISSFSQNKELAWEFLKFAMGDHDFSFFDNAAIPVNRQKAERMYDRAGIQEDVKEKLFSNYETVNIKGSLDVNLWISIYPVLESYYRYDLISAEECAEQLADRTYLYLNE